ncbi:MAG: hypothetical protein N2651_10325 [Fimbriimonadales bacterium]|nr:hypothetical protein [Fimbriimonadales bacterium]
MAKPIPLNRRWQENQQRRQGAQNDSPADPPARTPYREALRQFIVALAAPRVREPSAAEVAQPAVPPRPLAVPPRVIPARYRQVCTGCGTSIRPGDPITRHPRWGDWVHAGCRDRQQRATRRVIEARYPGFCRGCARPIHPGQLITSRAGYGWVHQECAPRE